MNALPICEPASMNATIQMLTDRPTSIEKPANTRPPSSAMRTRLPRSATFAIGTDSASAAPNASTNGMVTPAMPTPKSSAMVGAVTENEHAGELVDRVEAEEDEQRPDRAVPVSPSSHCTGWRNPVAVRCVPGRVRRRLREHRDHAAPPRADRRRARLLATTGAGSADVGHVRVVLVGSVATSASRLGTTMPLPAREPAQPEVADAGRTRRSSPPGSRSSTSEHADARREQPPRSR